MALRELFATFTFDFDQKTLDAAHKASAVVEAKVEGVARAFDAASGRATAARGPLGAWANIARTVGVSAGAFRGALGEMSGRLRSGSEEVAGAAKELGVDLERVTAAGRSQASVWTELTGRLARVEDASKRARLALALLGDTGAQIAIPATAEGPATLRTALRVSRPGAPRVASAPEGTPSTATVGALQRLRNAWQTTRLAQAQYREEQAKLRKAVDPASDGLAWYERRLRNVRAQGAGPVGQLLQTAFWVGLGYSVFRAGEAFTRLGVGLGATLLRKAYDAAEALEATRKSLGAITGLGEQKGAAELRHVREEVKRFGLDFEPAVAAYTKLRNAGFSMGDALDYSTRAVADFKDAQGATDEQVQAFQETLAKVQINGLGGDSFRGLRAAGISEDDILKRLSNTLGVTTKKVKELIEQDKVAKPVALKAIRESVLAKFGTKDFGQASDSIGTSLRGGMGKARAGIKDWFLSLGETLTPAFTHLSGVIGATFSKFSSDGTFERVTEAITRVLTDLIDLVEIHWPRVERILRRGAQGGADSLGTLASALDSMIDGFLTAVEWVQDNWPQISATISDACTVAKYAIVGIVAAKTLSALATGAAAIRKIGADASEVAGLVRSLAGALGISTAALGAIAAAVVAWGVAVYQAIQLWNEWDTSVVVAKLKSDWASLVSWFGGIWDQALGMLSGGLDRAYQIGSDTAAELRRGFIDSLGPVAGALGLERGTEGVEPASANLRGLSETRTYTPRAVLPMTGGAGGRRAVVLTDQRSTVINVQGAASPAATGREVGNAVSKQQGADLGAMQAALVGAGQ